MTTSDRSAHVERFEAHRADTLKRLQRKFERRELLRPVFLFLGLIVWMAIAYGEWSTWWSVPGARLDVLLETFLRVHWLRIAIVLVVHWIAFGAAYSTPSAERGWTFYFYAIALVPVLYIAASPGWETLGYEPGRSMLWSIGGCALLCVIMLVARVWDRERHEVDMKSARTYREPWMDEVPPTVE